MIVTSYDERDVLYLVRNLEDFEKNKVLKNGIRAALDVFKRKGKANLLERMLYHGKHTNALENSFRTQTRRNNLGGYTGFLRSTKWIQYKNAGNHAHLVDLGTAARYTKKGSYRGMMPANHFWTDAFESEKDTAAERMMEAIRINVERINARR